MQRCAVFGGIDLVSDEHAFDPCRQTWLVLASSISRLTVCPSMRFLE